MALIDPPVTTYDDTVLKVRIIDDIIHLINPMDTPVVALLGLDSARSKFNIKENGTKIELIEDAMAPLSVTMAQGTTITTSTLSFTVSDASDVQVGQILKLDSEYVVISAVNLTTNVITVYSRDYGGTNATHTATLVASIVGVARLEGADVSYASLLPFTVPYNYTAILQKGIKVTRTEAQAKNYGMASYLTYQEDKSIPEKMRDLERMFFYGIRAIGSKTTPRSFGGIGTFVTGNSSSITTTITKAAVEAVAAAIFNDGGRPDTLIMGAGAAGNLRTLLDSSSFVRVTQEETSFGMRPITRINTQFFENIQMVVSRHCPANKAYMVDSSKLGFYTFEPFTSHDIGYGGDWRASEVIGEFSFIAANDAAHGYITTTAASL